MQGIRGELMLGIGDEGCKVGGVMGKRENENEKKVNGKQRCKEYELVRGNREEEENPRKDCVKVKCSKAEIHGKKEEGILYAGRPRFHEK